MATSREREQAGLSEPIPDDLHPAVLEGLAAAGIESLWAHQADTLEAARRGHAIVTTGHRERQVARLQPARARHARERRGGARLLPLPDEGARAGPGARARARSAASTSATRSTTATRRARSAAPIRQRSNLILTNPDMLHVGVLPNHRSWGDVLANLAWVVVDEAHVYRGVFGSHVANVLRRLRRLARAYGSDPRFLLTSATIANPSELAERLTGVGGAARGPRRRPARRAPDRDVEPAARGRAARAARLGAVRGGEPAGRAGRARDPNDLLPEVAPRRGADPALRAPAPGGRRAGPTSPSASRPTARATRRRSGARSSSASPRATCWRWWPPTRSSSASTSATSTRRSA